MENPEIRIAIRSEGKMWNAYLAKPDTMKHAVLLSSVALTVVADPKCKELYLEFIQKLFVQMAQNLGLPFDDTKIEVAPEHERGNGSIN
jgi:hypothetical protein